MTTANPSAGYLCLREGETFLAFAVAVGERPICLYAGPNLPGVEPSEIALLSSRQHAPGGPEEPLRGSLMNEIGTGISGPNGLLAHRFGRSWAVDLRVVDIAQQGSHSATIRTEDPVAKIACTHNFSIDPNSGVLTSNTHIENLGEDGLQLDWCAALCLPIDTQLNRFMSFTGRWAGEFQIEEFEAQRGTFLRENKAGRTSHDALPALIAKTPQTNEQQGLAAAFHLAWSGNSRLRVDKHSDGRSFVQMGEQFLPGELQLNSGEAYQTPDLLCAWSADGLNGLSHAFHRHLAEQILDRRTAEKPRPVHYNTWEAVYFDHEEKTLLNLAEKAAAIGAERFVLDDGWFGGRRNDTAGLGDWWVSKEVYPRGLHAIASRVRELGMEFGLWFEPEMVNPDSDLYRAHPDWVLGTEGAEPIASRSQLPLDLTKREVSEYLFDKITSLVTEYAIDYIKWDMNRDIQHPGNSEGLAAAHRQALAVYALIDRLRATHPMLEIESCASGGGRADFGVLRRTDRLWTSDNNDARDRHRIMRGASHFFPLNVLGNHIGPKRCHITGRHHSMEFRVAAAIFGHMGMELDLRDESSADLAVLKAGIALHKKHRELIHSGRFVRINTAAHINCIGCVSADKSEGLFGYSKLDEEPCAHPDKIRFTGLDAGKSYRLRMVWPDMKVSPNPSISNPSIIDAAALQDEGGIFGGAALMGHGIQPPLTFPDTGLIFHLEAAD